LIGVLLLFNSSQTVKKSSIYNIPSDINIKNVESYLFKSVRLKKINLPQFSDTLYLIPKFSSTYYASAYNNICDLKENCMAVMYLTEIGNISMASKIIHSMIYLMMENKWNPYAISSLARIIDYKGLPNIYNIDILSSTISLRQVYSDISSIYLSMALTKFLITYDNVLSKNINYTLIKKLYITAAYDLWKFIVDRQRCSGSNGVFHNYRTSIGLPSEFTTSFHIAMYACCGYMDKLVEKYGLIIDTTLNIQQVRDICEYFINTSNNEGVIVNMFGDCSLTYDPESDPIVMNKVSEDYLNLLLLDYPIDQNTIIDNLLTQFYVADTDSLPTGCGAGIYNIECKDPSTSVENCYNITCNSKYVKSDRVFYGVKWSTKGSGLTFSMSALTVMTLLMKNNLTSELVNIRNSLIKLYREYGGLFIVGGFQEELAYSGNPLNTGTGDSIFKYPSLLSVVLSGFMFLYLTTGSNDVNYMIPTDKNFQISTSVLGFDDSPVYISL
jgi:hypothetical protein